MNSYRLSLLVVASLSAAVLAGCSAEASVATVNPAAVSAAKSALVIDPAIPALTIVARRMSPADKFAYDQERNSTINAAVTGSGPRESR